MTGSTHKMGSAGARAKPTARRWPGARALAAALLPILVWANAGAAGTPGRVVLHVDADPVDYCLYDGRPYSEGAYIDTPGGVLVCTYRERAAGSGESYTPAAGQRRLKWLRREAPATD